VAALLLDDSLSLKAISERIKRLPVTQNRSPEARKFLFHCLLDGEQFTRQGAFSYTYFYRNFDLALQPLRKQFQHLLTGISDWIWHSSLSNSFALEIPKGC